MENETADTHKFMADARMSYQEVFDFAYGGMIPVFQGLASALGEERFYQALQQVVCETSLEAGQETARQLPCNDFAAFTAGARQPSAFAQHILSLEIVEDTPQAFEVKVSECLWAKFFRERDAAELGTHLICERDFADCQGFNPGITLVRTKTLMQGDECCNHRFVWQG